ncbi:TPA: hypothetical protein JLF26_004943 [Escherichia coli]|nr:hypothetical protein [Escherichia coli]
MKYLGTLLGLSVLNTANAYTYKLDTNNFFNITYTIEADGNFMSSKNGSNKLTIPDNAMKRFSEDVPVGNILRFDSRQYLSSATWMPGHEPSSTTILNFQLGKAGLELTTKYHGATGTYEYSTWGQDEDRFIPGINNQTDSFMGSIICEMPKEIKSDYTAYDYTLHQKGEVEWDLKHGISVPLIFRWDCSARYIPDYKLSISVDKSIITLTGNTGVEQKAETTLQITGDSGYMYLKIDNAHQDDLHVSFSNEKLIERLNIQKENTIEKLPIFIRTINTKSGVRTYNVNITASFG